MLPVLYSVIISLKYSDHGNHDTLKEDVKGVSEKKNCEQIFNIIFFKNSNIIAM